jgi:hypothetical protein
VSWSQRFDTPITLPNGGQLATLGEARAYLLRIPTADYTEAMGLAAETLLMAAENRGPMMHANKAMALVVYGAPEIPEPRPSTTRPWGRAKLLRDR